MLLPWQSFPVPPRPGPSPWILVNALVILTVIVLAFVAYRRQERRRARALTAIAAGMGFQFQYKGVVGPQKARLPLFQADRKAFAKNILFGTAPEGEVLIFHYFCPSYQVQPTPGQPVEQSVAAFRFPGAELPALQIRGRTFLDKVPGWVQRLLGERYQEVTLDTNPDFRRRWVLLAKDVNAARTLLAPQAARLSAAMPVDDWHVEASGEWLLAYRPMVLLEPRAELYREFFAQASNIASAISRRKSSPYR